MVETLTSKQETKRKKSFLAAQIIKLTQVESFKFSRLPTGLAEFDRVLGGGIVPGSVILIAGEPGIGKSTLLSQLALSLVKNQNQAVFYVCGEESPQQVKLRLERINNLAGGRGELKNLEKFFLLPQTDVDEVVDLVKTSEFKEKSILIVDSIQTMTSEELSGSAGSIGQTRESAHRLIDLAKREKLAVFLVGHITKEGTVAGPKTLEHMVDAVFYFEGEKYQNLRLLRSVKNRFGATDEVGLWQMTDKGLQEVKDPTGIWLEKGKTKQPVVGSALTVVIEGTRPMVIEVQSLVSQTFLPAPKRIINGVDYNRSQILLAVIQKQLKIPLFKYDVFINITGGLKTNEPGADLAICAALVSSFKNKLLPPNSVFIGEVSLLGEVREVWGANKRIKEAKSLGIKQIFDKEQIPWLVKLYGLLANG